MFEGGIVQLFLVVNALIFGAVIVLAVQHFRAHQHQKRHQDPTGELLSESTRKKLAQDTEREYQAILTQSSKSFSREVETIASSLRVTLAKISKEITTAEMERYQTQLAELRTKAQGSIGAAIAEIEQHQIELKQQLAERKKTIDEELAHQSTLIAETFADHQSSIKTTFETQHLDLQQQQVALNKQLLSHQDEIVTLLDEQVAAYKQQQSAFEATLTDELAKRREAMIGQFDQTVADTLFDFITESLGETVDIESQRMQLLSSLEANKKELLAELAK